MATRSASEASSSAAIEGQASTQFTAQDDAVATTHCFNCGKKSLDLKACTRCQTAKYCDKVCQTNHWKEHRLECKEDPSRSRSKKEESASSATERKTPAKISAQNNDLVEHVCMQCGKRSPNLKSCTRCWNVKYCDRDCQKKHWKQHKLECQQDQRSIISTKDTGLEKLLLWSEAARLQQGDREMEILPECDTEETHETCLHLKERCMKNAGHREFISVTKLNLNHLPPGWRHPTVLAIIKQHCAYTVKLIVAYTSLQRPDSRLWFGQYKGQHLRRIGSGCCDTHYKEQPCPIKNCSVSSFPHTVFAIQILTAAHVVYDDSEAEKTTVEFFHDNETDKTSIVRLQEVVTSQVFVDDDMCVLTCVTHDPDVLSRIEERCDIKNTLKFYVSPRAPPLCFVVSHPHGCGKQISFGQMKNKLDERDEDVDEYNREYGGSFQELSVCKFQYTCATCPGSSGGLFSVIDPSDGKMKESYAPHSRHNRRLNVNVSGTGSYGVHVL